MGYPNGDIKLSSNFELSAGIPLDSRIKVDNYSDLDNIDFKYEGMIVWVVNDENHYKLSSDLLVWTELTEINTIESQGEYNIISYVDQIKGNNDTAVLGSPNKPYKTINHATQASQDYLFQNASTSGTTSGGTTLIYGSALTVVREGTYYEHTINREYVDMYFNFGAIVISNVPARPVITDVYSATNGKVQPLNINIMGLGQFYHTNFNPAIDSQGVSTSNANTILFNFEAYEVDGLQFFGNAKQSFNIKNMRIRFLIDFWNNKYIIFDKCIFLSGLSTGHFTGEYTHVKCHDCEFILPENLDHLVPIIDINGDIIENITYQNGYGGYEILDTTSGLTRTDVRDYIRWTTYDPLIAGINHTQPDRPGVQNGNNVFRTFRLYIIDSLVRIQKENCIGINVIQRYDMNNTIPNRGFVMLKNIHIEDETINRTITGINTGYRVFNSVGGSKSVTQILQLGLEAITTNAIVPIDYTRATGEKGVDQGDTYEELPLSYNNLPMSDPNESIDGTRILNNSITLGKLQEINSLSIIGNTNSSTSGLSVIESIADKQILRRNGTTLGFGFLNHSYISDFDDGVSANSDVISNTSKVSNANHTGDVTGDTVLTIGDSVVTNSKLSNMIGNTIKGNNDVTGVAKDLSISEVITMLNVETTTQLNSRDSVSKNYTDGLFNSIELVNDSTSGGSLKFASAETVKILNTNKLNVSEKGSVNGVAELDENGVLKTSQLPSSIDDIIEAADLASFPVTGTASKIYLAIDTNIAYRWGGSTYVAISNSLALGVTASNAYRGDRGEIAYIHSQLTTSNPHNVTKDDIGLSNVPNTDFTSAVDLNTSKVSNANHTGDVTGDTVLTIGDNKVTTNKILDSAVTLDKITDISTNTFLGRNTAGSGVIEILSVSDARNMLNVETSTEIDARFSAISLRLTIIPKTAAFSTTASTPNAYYRFDKSTTAECTIRNDACVIGDIIYFRQIGTGVLTFVGDTFVTLNANINGYLKTVGQGNMVAFVKVANNEFDML